MWRRARDADGKNGVAVDRRTCNNISMRHEKHEPSAAEERAEEEVLLALRMMCQSGLRHPLHGHSYARYRALRPRVCFSCEAPVFGPFSVACHCLLCGIIVHRQCVMRITKVPCGNYRGLHDPSGLLSSIATPREYVHMASTETGPHETAVADEKKADKRESSVSQTHGRAEEPTEEKQARRERFQKDQSTARDGRSVIEDKEEGRAERIEIGDGPEPGVGRGTSSSVETGLVKVNAGARGITYDALVQVGKLMGNMIGGDANEVGARAAVASLLKISTPEGGSSGGKGASCQEEDGAGGQRYWGERWSKTLSGSVDMAVPPPPVAMAWSHLAQRWKRSVSCREPPMSLAAFLELGNEENTKERCQGPHGKGMVERKRVSCLIEQILRCPETPPGGLWAACLDQFVARHAATAPAGSDGFRGCNSSSIDASRSGREWEGADMPVAGVATGSCSQDAAAIIQEVSLTLMEYVPGLLGPSMEACEDAFVAVETEIMTTLYPSVLGECQEQARSRSSALEGWYLREPDAREERGMDGAGARNEDPFHRAVQELVGMSQEVTGRNKVARVLQSCLALGEGRVVTSADDLLPALAGVVRSARIPALPAHLAFIDQTCDTGALLGAEGYALTSLQVCRGVTE